MVQKIEERIILHFCESCKKALTEEEKNTALIDKFPFVCANCRAFLIEQMKICIPLMQNLKY